MNVASLRQQDVRAISIRQPYAWAILRKHKRIENRTWATRYRGPLFIHASSGRGDYDWVAATFGLRPPADLPRSAFIAVCRLSDVVTHSRDAWFEGPFGFVLDGVKPLRRPVPADGKLNLWRPSPAQIRAVVRQLP